MTTTNRKRIHQLKTARHISTRTTPHREQIQRRKTARLPQALNRHRADHDTARDTSSARPYLLTDTEAETVLLGLQLIAGFSAELEARYAPVHRTLLAQARAYESAPEEETA